MADPLAIGIWLRQRRTALDLSRPALAARAHCAPATIKKLEEGQRTPSTQLAEHLVRALEIPVATQPTVIQWLRGYRSLPPTLALAPEVAPSGAVVAPGALMPLPSPRPSLPAPLTPLVGRARERAEVGALLQQPSTRLLTLTGEGGIGKTHLAQAVAADLEAAFGDGVAYVDLAPLHDPALVPATIAAALGIPEHAQQSVGAQIAQVLCPQHRLLVLDNFEHLLPATPLLGDLLRAAPRLTLLITSRVVLDIAGETAYRLPPLAAADAQALFLTRARARQPGLVLSAENATAIGAICARLAGLPLALELAAAHSHFLAPVALLAQLTPGLPVLAGGRRDSPPRQQTLRATLDWSYALLPPEAQQLFRRLAVFAGSGPLAGAAAVAQSAEPPTLLMLETLLNHSLLRPVENSADGRFIMLDPIREYADEQLAASGERDRVRQAHAQYYLGLAEHAAGLWRGAERQDGLARLDAEQPNLRAALAWTVSAAPAVAIRLAAALRPFWAARGYWSEGRHWLEVALTTGEPTPAERAALLQGAGTLARLQADRRAALGWLQASLALYQEVGEPRGAAACLYGLADLARAEGERERSAQFGAESLALYRRAGEASGIVDALLFCADEGDDDQVTVARYQEALDLAEAHQYLPGIALARLRLAGVAEGQEDLPGAVQLYEESLVLFRALGDQRRIATVVEVLGEITASTGAAEPARTYFAESHGLYRQLGARDGLMSVAYNLAKLDQVGAQWAAMAAQAEQGLAEAWAIGNGPGIRDGLLLLGHARLHLGEHDTALAAYGAALEQVTARTSAPVLVSLLLGLAGLAAAADRLPTAAACLGAVEAHGQLNVHEREHFAQVSALVYAGLDTATCATAWSQGQSWTAADIAAFAWRELARPGERPAALRPSAAVDKAPGWSPPHR